MALLKAFRKVKGLRRASLTITNLCKTILHLEKTGTFAVKPGRDRKPTRLQKVEELATEAVVAEGASACTRAMS